MSRGRRGGMPDQLLVRFPKALRRRLNVERRRRQLDTEPATIRAVLEDALPPDPGKADDNQLRIGDDT